MTEKYIDPLDQAAAIAAAAADDGIAAARRRAAPEQTKNEDGTWPVTECLDCGCDIPEGRLNLGKVRCVFCQEAKERKERGL